MDLLCIQLQDKLCCDALSMWNTCGPVTTWTVVGDCSYMGQVIRCVNTYLLNSHCCLPTDICLVNTFETDAWTFILLGLYVPNAVYRLGGGVGWGSHETWEESPVLQELVTKQWNLMVIGTYHLLCARPYAKSFYTYILI